MSRMYKDGTHLQNWFLGKQRFLCFFYDNDYLGFQIFLDPKQKMPMNVEDIGLSLQPAERVFMLPLHSDELRTKINATIYSTPYRYYTIAQLIQVIFATMWDDLQKKKPLTYFSTQDQLKSKYVKIDLLKGKNFILKKNCLLVLTIRNVLH